MAFLFEVQIKFEAFVIKYDAKESPRTSTSNRNQQSFPSQFKK